MCLKIVRNWRLNHELVTVIRYNTVYIIYLWFIISKPAFATPANTGYFKSLLASFLKVKWVCGYNNNNDNGNGNGNGTNIVTGTDNDNDNDNKGLIILDKHLH